MAVFGDLSSALFKLLTCDINSISLLFKDHTFEIKTYFENMNCVPDIELFTVLLLATFYCLGNQFSTDPKIVTSPFNMKIVSGSQDRQNNLLGILSEGERGRDR